MINKLKKLITGVFHPKDNLDIKALSREDLEDLVRKLQNKKNSYFPFKSFIKNKFVQDSRFYLEQLSDIVFEVDQTGNFIFVNQSFENAFGYTREEIIGQNCSVLVSPEDKNGLTQDFFDEASWSDAKVVRFKHKNDEWRWIECRGNLIKLQDGNVSLIILSKDITHTVVVDQAKAIEKALILKLVNSLPDNIFVKNLNGEYIFANQRMAEVIGVNSHLELIGKTDFDFYPPQVAQSFSEDEKKILNSGEPLINKEELVRDGNHISYYITSKVPIRENDGTITGIIGIGKEITESKVAAKKLEESEQKYRFLIENAPIGIFRSTSQGKLLEANPLMAKIFGYNSSDELLSGVTNLAEQFYVVPQRRNELIRQLRSTGEVENFEFEGKTLNGSHLWLSMNARISQSLEDHFVIEGFITDITEKKNSEVQILKQNNELRELNATKDKFFSIIAHDLRNPFNGMQALSMLVLKNYEEYEKDQVKEILDLINQSADRGVRLLENLLEWSRSQTGKMEYSPEDFALSELIDETISLLSNQALKKKIKVISSVTDDVRVYADKNMIFTVVRNLISNSIKFTFNDGEINVFTELVPDGFIKVTVSDNGMGIMPEYKDLLFKLGYNYSTKGTANETGTGLGLILCKDFVEKNGGKIWLESVYEKGSKFIFTIPSSPSSSIS